jgi:hypothetical protein
VDDEVHTGPGGPADRDGARHISHFAMANLLRSAGHSPQAPARPSKTPSTPTGTPSSATSTPSPSPFSPPPIRRLSASTPSQSHPYGVYDTSVFTVATIKEWRPQAGARKYPTAWRNKLKKRAPNFPSANLQPERTTAIKRPTIVNLVANTTPHTTGLTLRANLGPLPHKIKLTDQ